MLVLRDLRLLHCFSLDTDILQRPRKAATNNKKWQLLKVIQVTILWLQDKLQSSLTLYFLVQDKGIHVFTKDLASCINPYDRLNIRKHVMI